MSVSDGVPVVGRDPAPGTVVGALLEVDDADAGDRPCRICLDAEGELMAPCRCRGTQGLVHLACLMRWRRLQVLQGKSAAASKCELCGVRYSESLGQVQKPLASVVFGFGCELVETAYGLGLYITSSNPLGVGIAGPVFFLLAGMHMVVVGVLMMALSFSLLVLWLYMNGMRLSVMGVPGNNIRLGITSFGAPVEGLSSGMLLVSIGARGLFEKTVLHVIQHDDGGSLAVILNSPLSSNSLQGGDLTSTGFEFSVRSGGPVELPDLVCIHDMEHVQGAERLKPGHALFISRGVRNLHTFLARDGPTERPGETFRVVAFKGISSWRDHQLEGEVRRGAWGWIKPEHVRASDILEMDPARLALSWELLLQSPHLEIFTA